jgi:hypothetical protein
MIDKWRRWTLVSVLVAENLALLAAWGIARWRQQGLSPVERGKQIAERLGCFTCHGPGGIRGITFAKKPRFDCPPWDGGTAMMYVHDESELAEWILERGAQSVAGNCQLSAGAKGAIGADACLSRVAER